MADIKRILIQPIYPKTWCARVCAQRIRKINSVFVGVARLSSVNIQPFVALKFIIVICSMAESILCSDRVAVLFLEGEAGQDSMNDEPKTNLSSTINSRRVSSVSQFIALADTHTHTTHGGQ